MPAPGQSTYDGNQLASPPILNGYRPTPADFNGAAMTDDPNFPPDPPTQPTSALMNTYSFLLTSIGKAVGVAGFGINAGGLVTFAFWWTAANLIASNPFTVVRNGAGDYSITWAANLFPIAGWPRAEINALPSATTRSIGCVNITNGVHVQTTQNGVLTDLPFSVEVF